jgi:hypothetical protein
MHNMMQAIKLDFYIIKGNYARFLVIAYIIGIAIGVFTKASYLTVPLIMIIMAATSGTYFSVRERNNLGKFYGALPLDRTRVVAARYLYTLIFGLINWAVAILLATVIMLAGNKGTDPSMFSFYASFSFFYFCLFIGIVFPIFYKFEYSKAYLFTSLPFYLIFILGLIISNKMDLTASLVQTFKYFTANPAMIWILGVGVGLAILAVSCLISINIYKKKDL